MQERPPEETSDSLGITLEALVPLQILEYYEEQGPRVEDVIAARLFGRMLAAEGDALLFRSSRPGKTTRLLHGLVRAIAFLAYLPGGVPMIFGRSFEAEKTLAPFVGHATASQYCRTVWEHLYKQTPQVLASCQGFTGTAGEDATITWNVTTWFETASLEQQLQLQQQGYRNVDATGMPIAESIVDLILQRQAVFGERLATWMEQAQQHGQSLRCQFDQQQAERWLYLHQRARQFLEE